MDLQVDMCRNNEDLIARLSKPAEGADELRFSRQYAQSSLVQFWWIEWKLQISYWRNGAYNGTRLLFATTIALLMGCILWNIGSKRYDSRLHSLAIMFAASALDWPWPWGVCT